MANSTLPVMERFMNSISPEPNSGCWLWTAAIANPQGYGRIGKDGKDNYAHRVSYELFVGPIPDGLQLDHLCRMRSCVNPQHLEPVTRQVNIRRGNNGGHNKIKTHCPKGHPYSGDNLYISCVGRKGAPNGSRICRTCHAMYTVKRRARLRIKKK